MKRFLLASLVAMLAFTTPTFAKEFEVDKAHSKVGFSVTHLQLNEVEGRFTDFTGTIDWNADNPAASKVRFEVNVNSIKKITLKIVGISVNPFLN